MIGEKGGSVKESNVEEGMKIGCKNEGHANKGRRAYMVNEEKSNIEGEAKRPVKEKAKERLEGR